MGPSPSSAEPSSTAFLRVAAVVLFGIFLVSVILRAMPPRMLDPLWQVALTASLVDMGGYALLGVVVLTLAHLLKPGDQSLLLLLLRVSRLSRLAALGYLLLVPLLLSALIRDYQRVDLLARRQLRDISQGEVRLRQAITSARTPADLQAALRGFNAPALPDSLRSDVPFEAQRARALDQLAASAAATRRQAESLSPGSLPSILLNNLRLVLLALLFAFGFSSAFSGGASFPLFGPLLRPLRPLPPPIPGGMSAPDAPASDPSEPHPGEEPHDYYP